MAQDTERWRALVNSVKNLRVRGISRVAEELLASQEGLCFV